MQSMGAMINRLKGSVLDRGRDRSRSKRRGEAITEQKKIFTPLTRVECDKLLEEAEKEHSLCTFVLPNELYPCDAKKLLKEAKPGKTFIAVGTERTLATEYDADRIVQIDYSPSIVLYNAYNVELIRACPDRETYLRLKTMLIGQEDGIEGFQSELKNIDYRPDSGKINIADPKFIIFMKRNAIYYNEYSDSCEAKRKVMVDPDKGFKNSYLHSRREFNRIKRLAGDNRITQSLLDLNSKERVEEFTKQLAYRSVGVVDLSNCLQYGGFIPNCNETLSLLQEKTEDPEHPIFLRTDCMNHSKLPQEQQHDDPESYWKYSLVDVNNGKMDLRTAW